MTRGPSRSPVAVAAARLSEYPKKELDRFLRATGQPARRALEDAAQSVAQTLHQTDALDRLVGAMTSDAKCVFFVLLELPPRFSTRDLEQRAWNAALIPGPRAKTALDALAELGLACSTSQPHQYRTMPGLEAGCRDAAIAWLTGAHAESPEPLDLVFLMALACSLVAEDAPRLTVQGRPHLRWLDRFAKRMAHPACPPAWAEFVLQSAYVTDLLCNVGDADAERLRPDLACAAKVLTMPPEDVRLAVCANGPDRSREVYAATLVERALRERTADGVDFAAVHGAARALEYVDRNLAREVVLPIADRVPALAAVIGHGAKMGLFAVDRDGASTRLRRTPPALRDGRWTVLPSFRVLVPQDVPPADVFRLGLIARLERVDRVAEFVLDRASVSRRVTFADLNEDALAILSARSSHELPEAVRDAVREWDRAARPVRAYVGACLVASDAAQHEAIRGDPHVGPEIAPGVFQVADDRLPAMLDRLSKRGIPTVAAAGGGGARRTASREQLARDVARVRTQIATLATAPAGRTRSVSLYDVDRFMEDELGLYDDEDEDAFLDDFFEDWPPDEELRAIGGGDRRLRGAERRAPAAATERPPSDPVWTPLALGDLRAWLGMAVARGVAIELLYTSSLASTNEVRLIPTELRIDGDGEWLDGINPAGRLEGLRLDRIAAVRTS